MNEDLVKQLAYYTDEEVIGSSTKYHRFCCSTIRNIYRRNLKKFQSWQDAVAVGLDPCGVCHPYYKPAGGAMEEFPQPQPAASLTSTVSTSQLTDWRRELVQFLNILDKGPKRQEKELVGKRIGRLTREGLIPLEMSAAMRTITEMRNAAEYQKKVLTPTESLLVEAAYKAIQEWAIGRGLRFPAG